MIVDSLAGLMQALDDVVGHIMLREGVYDLTSGMTEMCSHGMLCLDYDYEVTIEAEVAGTVVLDAARSNRVLYITGTGVQLVGLNITGGYRSDWVSVPKSNACTCLPSHMLAFWRPIHRPAGTLRD